MICSQECKIEMTVMSGANKTVQLSSDQVIFYEFAKLSRSNTGARDGQRQNPEKILPAVI